MKCERKAESEIPFPIYSITIQPVLNTTVEIAEGRPLLEFLRYLQFSYIYFIIRGDTLLNCLFYLRSSIFSTSVLMESYAIRPSSTQKKKKLSSFNYWGESFRLGRKSLCHLILDTLMTLCKGDSDKNVKKYPQRFHLEPQDKIKVLTPSVVDPKHSPHRICFNIPSSVSHVLN
jgi:hypothetical protein